MKRALTLAAGAVLATSAVAAAAAEPWAIEPHQRLADAGTAAAPRVALTLDACGGAFDADLLATLVRLRVPATVFVTRRWLRANPAGVAALRAEPALFELQNHGTAHVPALLGAGRQAYGIAGVGSAARLAAEVNGAAEAIVALGAPRPAFFRGATAVYDAEALAALAALGVQVAGFSVNADAGATAPRAAIVARLRGLQPGDVVIAHMNRPAGATAEALAEALPALLARGVRFVPLSQGGGLQALVETRGRERR